MTNVEIANTEKSRREIALPPSLFVVGGLAIERIVARHVKRPFPKFIEPMMASLAREPFNDLSLSPRHPEYPKFRQSPNSSKNTLSHSFPGVEGALQVTFCGAWLERSRVAPMTYVGCLPAKDAATSFLIFSPSPLCR